MEPGIREVRPRLREIGPFQAELQALGVVHALLSEAQSGWQRLSMSPQSLRTLGALRVAREITSV